MASEFGKSISASFWGNVSNDSGEFECNICFEVAQDSIVTLCGHLYCWSCLYVWLHNHSHCQDCPVCKALVKEEDLVPIYGRGKKSPYPRSSLILVSDIPNRPAGRRPETAPTLPSNTSNFRQDDFGSMRGLILMASARIRNFTNAGALIQSLNSHVSGLYDVVKFLQWFFSSLHGGHHVHGSRIRSNQQQRRDSILTMPFFVFGFALIVSILLLLTFHFISVLINNLEY